MPKDIDRLIEEELTVCEVCEGQTVKMSTNCPVHGGPFGSLYNDYVQQLNDEVALRDKWTKEKKRELLAAAAMNLLLFSSLAIIAVVVILEIIRAVVN